MLRFASAFSKVSCSRRLHCLVVSLNLVYTSHKIDIVDMDVGREKFQFPVGPRLQRSRKNALPRRSPTRDLEQQTRSSSMLVAHHSLDDTTVRDLHLGRRTSATRANGLDRFDNVHTLYHLAENNMFAVEP